MDESMLLNGVLQSVFGGRRRRSKRAMRYLGGPLSGSLGSIGGSLLSNPNVLLTAAGVAWGIYETLQQPEGNGSVAPAGAPSATGTTATAPLPPLPVVDNSASPVSDHAMQIVRLA